MSGMPLAGLLSQEPKPEPMMHMYQPYEYKPEHDDQMRSLLDLVRQRQAENKSEGMDSGAHKFYQPMQQ